MVYSSPINIDWWNFEDVKVFAGDGGNHEAADASYKNLVWENLPAPDIFLTTDTPAVVSLKVIKILKIILLPILHRNYIICHNVNINFGLFK